MIFKIIFCAKTVLYSKGQAKEGQLKNDGQGPNSQSKPMWS